MRLYVGGLPYQTTEQDLVDLFQSTGNVTLATVITDRATGRSKGFGFVEMGDDKEANLAIEKLNGTSLGDRTITVSEAHERPAPGGGGGNRGGFQGRDRRPSSGGFRNNDRY
jgi:cold-inducible RNA-binding protein